MKKIRTIVDDDYDSIVKYGHTADHSESYKRAAIAVSVYFAICFVAWVMLLYFSVYRGVMLENNVGLLDAMLYVDSNELLLHRETLINTIFTIITLGIPAAISFIGTITIVIDLIGLSREAVI